MHMTREQEGDRELSATKNKKFKQPSKWNGRFFLCYVLYTFRSTQSKTKMIRVAIVFELLWKFRGTEGQIICKVKHLETDLNALTMMK